ncbi:sterol desaturase family protein [Gordonia polyisoprenivorans]|uniref:sterol desaturase family protein n=1 Tax=Gordonia polyisoprenivorans TaxID=84595 RepID=UPI002234CB9E|nr:sterol desaturase family protein [Gordonia polyisoprenivorans]
MLDLLPDPMHEPTVLAIPFFVALLVLEWFAAWKLEDRATDTEATDTEDTDTEDTGPAVERRSPVGAYEKRDARASISMGLVSIATSAVWKIAGLLVYTAIFVYIAPWQLPIGSWYTWVIGFVAVDVLYYWNHRISHRVRLVWATHQAHHSSEYFNFATALRQKWNISAALVMWLPLPFLGIPPAVVFACYGVNLVYQFWIHTEHIDRMWRPVEFVFNTPSHHRVHHGSDPEYLDRNYAGVFILWDRMFGSFRAEAHRPHYGLTKPVGTYNIWTLQTHEYVSIARDVRAAAGWRAKLGYIFGPPGWSPTTGDAPSASAAVSSSR